jgi:hypothetical protein
VVGYSSGQRGQTVNLLAYAFEGSNPSPTTTSTFSKKQRKNGCIYRSKRLSPERHSIALLALAARQCRLEDGLERHHKAIKAPALGMPWLATDVSATHPAHFWRVLMASGTGFR